MFSLKNQHVQLCSPSHLLLMNPSRAPPVHRGSVLSSLDLSEAMSVLLIPHYILGYACNSVEDFFRGLGC